MKKGVKILLGSILFIFIVILIFIYISKLKKDNNKIEISKYEWITMYQNYISVNSLNIKEDLSMALISLSGEIPYLLLNYKENEDFYVELLYVDNKVVRETPKYLSFNNDCYNYLYSLTDTKKGWYLKVKDNETYYYLEIQSLLKDNNDIKLSSSLINKSYVRSSYTNIYVSYDNKSFDTLSDNYEHDIYNISSDILKIDNDNIQKIKQNNNLINKNVSNNNQSNNISNKNIKNNHPTKSSSNIQADKKIENLYTTKIPILTFHRIVPDDLKKERYTDNQWVQSVNDFEKMMRYLYVNNYKTISAQEFYEWYIGKREYDKKTIMITFDDGVYDEYYYAYPIIKKYNFKATSFLIGSNIKDKTESYDKDKYSYYGLDVINTIRDEYPNFDFQSHSYNMHYATDDGKYRIESMNINELEEDFALNKKFGFKFMAYPFGYYNENAIKAAKDQGYIMAFAFAPYGYATRNSNQYAIPRIKINGQATIEELRKWVEYKK